VNGAATRRSIELVFPTIHRILVVGVGVGEHMGCQTRNVAGRSPGRSCRSHIAWSLWLVALGIALLLG
jgi:hypothetical protein